MIVDTSAIIAIPREEDDADRCVQALAEAHSPAISVGTYLEAAVVVDASRDPVLSGRFDDLVKSSAMTIEPVTAHQAEIARHAYRSFGRGSGHAAGLYFSDCFAYALARSTGDQLLFKGDDFTFTDVIDALADRGY